MMCIQVFILHTGMTVRVLSTGGMGGEGSTPNSISSPQNFNENLLKVYI